MGNIFADAKEIRQARKAGGRVEMRGAVTIPVLNLAYWGSTMEFCLLGNREAEKAVGAVFNSFPKQVQHFLTFTPDGPGGWVARARFWQQRLKPALPEKLYHAVMQDFVHWYARCLRLGKAAA